MIIRNWNLFEDYSLPLFKKWVILFCNETNGGAECVLQESTDECLQNKEIKWVRAFVQSMRALNERFL